MTTTEIELHVYITSEDDCRHVAVFDATLPYHRPEVDDLWGDHNGMARRPAPLAGRVYVDPSASAQDIAGEVAYLALTDWPRPANFDWRDIVFRRGYVGNAVAESPVREALGELHRVQEFCSPHFGERNVRIDIDAACSAAEERCDLELQLEHETCLSDEDAVAWLDGDRSILPRLVQLAERARVRSFGVYAAETELLDTIVVRPPPEERPEPKDDLTAVRWRTACGRQMPSALYGSQERDVLMSDHGTWPGGHTLVVMDTAVRRGLAEWVDLGRHSRARVTARGRSYAGGVAPIDAKIADLLRRADDRGFLTRPRRLHEACRPAFGHEYQHGEVVVFASSCRSEIGISSADFT